MKDEWKWRKTFKPAALLDDAWIPESLKLSKVVLTPRWEDAAELEFLLGWMDWSAKIQLEYLPKDGLDHVCFTNWNVKEHEIWLKKQCYFQFLRVKQ